MSNSRQQTTEERYLQEVCEEFYAGQMAEHQIWEAQENSMEPQQSGEQVVINNVTLPLYVTALKQDVQSKAYDEIAKRLFQVRPVNQPFSLHCYCAAIQSLLIAFSKDVRFDKGKFLDYAALYEKDDGSIGMYPF